MPIQISTTIILLLAMHLNASGQTYDCDSLKIDIAYKNHFLVKEYKDLNIEVSYFCTSKVRKALVYDYIISSGKSIFGNCYFELFKWDSAFGGSRNITSEVTPISEMPDAIKTDKNLLTYDPNKSFLNTGNKRTLSFNILKEIHFLPKGKYSMILHVRIGNKFGYDKKGQMITNSIQYVETPSMNFEVPEDICYSSKP